MRERARSCARCTSSNMVARSTKVTGALRHDQGPAVTLTFGPPFPKPIEVRLTSELLRAKEVALTAAPGGGVTVQFGTRNGGDMYSGEQLTAARPNHYIVP